MSATHMIDSTTADCSCALSGLRARQYFVEARLHHRCRPEAQNPHDSGAKLAMLLDEIAKAKQKLRLPEDTPVISCYEAGRDGFWLHRFLAHHRVENLVVDAASIEVNRRKRRAKSDNLDATKLVGMLIRWHLGEKKLWGIVRVPTAADEDRRQLHRELIELKTQRTEHVNRIKGLLAGIGLSTLRGCRPSSAAGQPAAMGRWQCTTGPATADSPGV